MNAYELFLQITIYVTLFIIAFAVFLVAVNDLVDEKSETSLPTKVLEGFVALLFVGAFIGGIITLVILLLRWVS